MFTSTQQKRVEGCLSWAQVRTVLESTITLTSISPVSNCDAHSKQLRLCLLKSVFILPFCVACYRSKPKRQNASTVGFEMSMPMTRCKARQKRCDASWQNLKGINKLGLC